MNDQKTYLPLFISLVQFLFVLCSLPPLYGKNISLIDGKSKEAGTVQSYDGTKIYYSLYRHQKRDNHSEEIVVYVQGRNSYTYDLDPLAVSFLSVAKKKVDYLAYDLRGQGRSDGPRCHVNSYDEYLGDLKKILEMIKPHYKKIHLLGASTGGLITALYLARNPNDSHIKSATLTNPFFEAKSSYFKKILYNFMAKIKTLTMSGSMQQAYPHSPCANPEEERLKCGSPTWGWVQASFQAQNELKNIRHNISVPLLITLGKEDQVVENEAAMNFCRQLSSLKGPKNCLLKEFEGIGHSALRGRKNRQVRKHIKNYFFSRE